MNADEPAPGRYRHYKGGLYVVVGTAIHSETEERLVVYRNHEERLFVRPLAMFGEQVVVDGRTVARFARIADAGDGGSG